MTNEEQVPDNLETVTFETVEMSAFRDKDIENDIWCERVFLFHSSEDEKAFFIETNPVLLGVYTEPHNRVLNDFEVHANNPAEIITSVSFHTEYAGLINLHRMESGFVCTKRYN